MAQPIREGRYEPVTPALDGRPPGWIVACADCTFRHDAHGDTSEAAVASITSHASDHHLSASPIDYTAPAWGKDRNQPHPLYPGGAP